ncbi:DUF2238 domain-containing protein [Dysgonomonas sp. 216]|uniref:DUF2238 domain-containing protein n=1 Tax=Dysgonomonas sp. 216 TaxID=2302934 RepID=UPI0013CF6E00|nr:DUF2238 domain-containing protein [Dysgonomonas sp. 216]NDW19619.1 DUF2238 domain-containing protein [Dysgonomonas sp. 216]
MNRTLYILIILLAIVALWSGINHFDYFTWVLEALPVILGIAVLAFTFKRFRFTDLTYIFIFVHCCILLVGAKYTYAEVPLFNWIQEHFGHDRNNYDKIGHFAQGFIPAMIARELIIRLNVLNKKLWLPFIVASICLSISAVYELFEWFVADFTGQSAEAFLGTQGYEWDAQSDMLCATIGAICMLLFLSKAQDKAILKNSI